MDRLRAANSVPFSGRDVTPGFTTGGAAQYATSGNPSVPTPATIWPAYAFNMMQDELLAVIAAAGITPDDTNWSQLLAAIQGLTRIKLTGNLNLYVSPTGSDSNNGLSSGTAFASIQKAWNTLRDGYDLGGWNATINLAAGTYTAGCTCSGYPAGAGAVSIVGANNASPGSTLISVVNANCFVLGGGCRQVSLQGMRMTCTGVAGTFSTIGSAVLAQAPGAQAFVSYCDFGPCGTAHLYAANGASIQIPSAAPSSVPYTISGGAAYHTLAGNLGIVQVVGAALTLTGTPAFSTAFLYSAQGFNAFFSNSVTGSATGPRYAANLNGVVATNGGYTSTPGSTAGSVSSGGQVA